MIEPQSNEPPLTRETNMEVMRLHEDLVKYLWARLTPSERELYTQIVDDPRNAHVNHIITLAYAAGLQLQLNRSSSLIETTIDRSNELLDSRDKLLSALNSRDKLLSALSGMVLGLGIAVIGLLGYIILS